MLLLKLLLKIARELFHLIIFTINQSLIQVGLLEVCFHSCIFCHFCILCCICMFQYLKSYHHLTLFSSGSFTLISAAAIMTLKWPFLERLYIKFSMLNWQYSFHIVHYSMSDLALVLKNEKVLFPLQPFASN